MSFCELDPTKLAYILKGRYSTNMEFKSTKLESFNGVKNQKVINVWLFEMKDYICVMKVDWDFVVELINAPLGLSNGISVFKNMLILKFESKCKPRAHTLIFKK
jgi:hypothetical protein